MVYDGQFLQEQYDFIYKQSTCLWYLFIQTEFIDADTYLLFMGYLFMFL